MNVAQKVIHDMITEVKNKHKEDLLGTHGDSLKAWASGTLGALEYAFWKLDAEVEDDGITTPLSNLQNFAYEHVESGLWASHVQFNRVVLVATHQEAKEEGVKYAAEFLLLGVKLWE